MKKILTVSMVFLFVCSLSAQTKSDKRRIKKEKTETKYQNLKVLIDSNQFQFVGEWAFPLGNDIAKISNAFVGTNNVFQGNRVNLIGNTNFIRFKGVPNTNLFLPYFGELYRGLSYGGTGNDNGLSFKGEIENYKVKYKDSKRQIEIRFTVNKPQEQLQMFLTINASGYANLNISSTNRENIRYQGKIITLEEQDAKATIAKN